TVSATLMVTIAGSKTKVPFGPTVTVTVEGPLRVVLVVVVGTRLVVGTGLVVVGAGLVVVGPGLVVVGAGLVVVGPGPVVTVVVVVAVVPVVPESCAAT